tara:strand:- start:332383 stop:333429 length:1047 start_codon:yes stop_codon:yes gene_type:complete
MTKRVAKLSLLSGCSLLFAVSFISTPSHAGFEWIPVQGATPPALLKPQEVVIPEPVYTQPVQMPAAEIDHHDAMSKATMHHVAVTPEPITAADEEAEVVTEEAAAPVESEELVIEEEIVAEVVEAEVEEIEAEAVVVTYEETMPKQEYATAYGFGKDMPLALALRQIVPASYAFSFENDVNIGTRVSWQGGEPWNEVLKTALRQQNLSAIIYDDMVLVRNAAIMADTAPMSAAPVAPPVATKEESASSAPTTLAVVPDYLNEEGSWLAVSGKTLRSVLSSWSDKTGVILHWDNVYDFAVTESWSYEGSYVHAVDALLGAFSDETPHPTARLHPNAPTGPAILVIEMAD